MRVDIITASDNAPYKYIEKFSDGTTKDISEEIPFEVPDSWVWSRLGAVFLIARGGSPRPIQEYITTAANGINWIKIGDSDVGSKYINDTREKITPEGALKSRFVNSGDLLLTNSMSFGRPYILNIDGCIHDGWLVLGNYNEILDINYFYHVLSSQFAFYQFYEQVSGAVVKNLNSEKVSHSLFPVPPLGEQHRIVECIEQLLVTVDLYGKAEKKLSNMNIDFPNSLKKSILRHAIQGRLVPQDPNDEPASVLLNRIQVERKSSAKGNKSQPVSRIIKRDNSYYEMLNGAEKCIDEEIPFDIPGNWEWARLRNVAQLLSGVDLLPDEYNPNKEGIPYITGASDFHEGTVSINRWTSHPKKVAKRGDLLLTCKGTIGSTAILEYDEVHIARQVMAIRTNKNILSGYFQIVLKNHIEGLKTVAKSMIPGICREDILSLLFPLPPLPEQQKIVDCIGQLEYFLDSWSRIKNC